MAGPRIRITHALEDLGSEDFPRFTAQMRDRREDGLTPESFRTFQVENKTRQQVADLLVDSFSDQAVSVTAWLLRAIGNNRVADELDPAHTTDSDGSLKEKLVLLRPTFVKNVSGPILDLLDHLEAEEYLNSQEVEAVSGKPRVDKARYVFDAVKNKGSGAVKFFINTYCELDKRSNLSDRMREILSETQ